MTKTKKKKIAEKINLIVDNIIDEIAGPGGHIPDGSGPPPHGKGMGPGKGTKSGKGMNEDEEEELDDK